MAGSHKLIALYATSNEFFLKGVLSGAPLCLPMNFFSNPETLELVENS